MFVWVSIALDILAIPRVLRSSSPLTPGMVMLVLFVPVISAGSILDFMKNKVPAISCEKNHVG